MLKVYVAGAYSDDNVMGVLRNIGRGQAWATQIFEYGMAPFTPWHDKSFVIEKWEKGFTVKQFYNYSMEWLRVSDAVFIVPDYDGLKNWRDSTGTLAEINEAEKFSIPVFYNIIDLLKFRDSYEH